MPTVGIPRPCPGSRRFVKIVTYRALAWCLAGGYHLSKRGIAVMDLATDRDWLNHLWAAVLLAMGFCLIGSSRADPQKK